MQVTSLGCPRPCGGANTELGATILLWRQAGVEITVVPTSPEDPSNPWPQRLRDAGCKVVRANLDDLQSVPGLAGGIVVGMCNHHVCEAWPTLQALRCRVIWSPCMTYTTSHEAHAFKTLPPAAVHFQSNFQAGKLAAAYDRWGVPPNRRHLIRGAFSLEDFPFRPAERNRRFVVGRLARSDTTKWPRDLFAILQAVHDHRIDLRVRLQAWSPELRQKCGKAPPWADCLQENTLSSPTFLAGCHALLCVNGGDEENWSRVGLEAMAAGVPVVAENRWGWPEMIRHGETGLLFDTRAECVEHLTRLATNEPLRLQLASHARAAVEELTCPSQIAGQWLKLFAELGG